MTTYQFFFIPFIIFFGGLFSLIIGNTVSVEEEASIGISIILTFTLLIYKIKKINYINVKKLNHYVFAYIIPIVFKIVYITFSQR